MGWFLFKERKKNNCLCNNRNVSHTHFSAGDKKQCLFSLFLSFVFFFFNQIYALNFVLSVCLSIAACCFFLDALLSRPLRELYLFLENAAWPHRFGQNNEHFFKGQLREKGFAQHIFTTDATLSLFLSFFYFLSHTKCLIIPKVEKLTGQKCKAFSVSGGKFCHLK